MVLNLRFVKATRLVFAKKIDYIAGMKQTMESGPFNWVKARAECNLDLSFEALRSVVQRDAQVANDTPSLTEGGTVRFSFQAEGQGTHPMFAVHRLREGSVFGQTRFTQHPQKITVDFGPASETSFGVTALWDDESYTCRLMMDGKPCEIWEVSRRALEWLFFGDLG